MPLQTPPPIHTDRLLWVAASLTPAIGIRRIHSLIRLFGSLEAAWPLALDEWVRAGVPAEVARNLDKQRRTFNPDAYLAKVEAAGASIVTYADDAYPQMLRSLPDAPPLLHVRGTLLPDERGVAVVGTRRASTYGRDAARHLAAELGRAGLTIISGLAHGIDAFAHRAALDAGARTIAVLGCGIDQVYPANHTALAQAIAHQGAVISEFPVGTSSAASNFPRRNRILSGLAFGVVIVEAPLKSGALITARTAADQGREVFAVPGSIFNPNSAGTHALIADGAKLVAGVESILEELPHAPPYHPVSWGHGSSLPALPLTDEQAALLRAFNGDSVQIDDLVRAAQQPAAVIAGLLSGLELEGFVELEQGGVYRMTQVALHLLRNLNP